MRMRPFLLLLFAAALSCACMHGCAASSSSSHGNESSSRDTAIEQMDEAQDAIEVSMEFDLSILPGVSFSQGSLSSGVLQAVAIPAGSTVYDALVATGAELEGTPAYISSIGGIGEGRAGSASGWMYMINGQPPTVAGNELVLNDGDSIKWYYGTWS